MTANVPRRLPPCQPGMLARLRRVQPEHAGRLVLVEQPAQPLRSPDGTSIPLWRVYTLRSGLRVGGVDYDDIIVAEACLAPVARLSKRVARRLMRAQARVRFDAALGEFGRWLKRNEGSVDADELDVEMQRAAEKALATRASMPVLLSVDR